MATGVATGIGLSLMSSNQAWAQCVQTTPGTNGVFTCTGTDTIGLNAGGGRDTINILSGAVVDNDGNAIRGGRGSDIITLADAMINRNIRGDGGEDTINITGGTVNNLVMGNNNDDVINMSDGVVITGVIGDTFDGGSSDRGNDIINLTGGTIGDIANPGQSGVVLGRLGNDTITLDGTFIDGFISGDELTSGTGDDVINLLSGTVSGAQIDGRNVAVRGGGGNDEITLSGAIIDSNIRGDEGDDLITITDGSVSRTVMGNSGNDTINVSGGLIQSSVIGDTFDGSSPDTGDDLINLTGGTIQNVSNPSGFAFVLGRLGDDTINLDGTFLDGIIVGDSADDRGGDDVINLLSGTVTGLNAGGSFDAVQADGGNDSVLVGQNMLDANIGGAVSGGDGTDSLRIEVADGSSRTITEGDYTTFETIVFRNDTDPGARGDITLTSTGADFVLDTGGTTGGTSVVFSQLGTINFANGGGSGNMIHAESVTFEAGTTLTGNGTIVTSNATATFNGTVAPGGFNTIGTLTIGTLNMTSAAAFGVDAIYAADLDNGGLSDLIDVTGAVALNGADLVINFLGDASLLMAGDVFTVINAGGPITGTMNLIVTPSALLSSGLEWEIFVDTVTFDVLARVVSTVPEPGTIGAFGAGAVGALALHRRRRRKKRQAR